MTKTFASVTHKIILCLIIIFSLQTASASEEPAPNLSETTNTKDETSPPSATPEVTHTKPEQTQATTQSTAINGKEQIVISFSGTQNGIDLGPQLLSYDFRTPNVFKIRETLIDSSLISLKFLTQEKSLPLLLQWPKFFLTGGQIRFFNNKKTEILLQEIDPAKLITTEQTGSSQTYQYEVLSDSDDFRKNISELPSFMACIEKKDTKSAIRLCSCNLKYETKSESISCTGAEKKQQIFIDDKEVTDHGIAYLNKGLTEKNVIKVRAQYANGASLLLVTGPYKMEVVDSTQVDKNSIQLVLKGGNPNLDSDYEPWTSTVALDSLKIPLVGRGGVPLEQELKMTHPPFPEAKRTRLDKDNFSTYESSLSLRGTFDPEIKLLGGPKSKVVSNKNRFSWTHQNLEAGKTNRRTLIHNYNKQPYSASFDTYRGLRLDAFGLFSVNVPDYSFSSFQIFSDISVGWWFEDLGMKKNKWTKHRLGIYGRSFNPISKLEASDKFNMIEVSTLYRFTPGLWEVDDSWGIKMDYLQTSFSGIDANLLGVGLFRTRPLPYFWRMLLEWLPIFRYPKWMYLEAMMSPIALNKVKIKSVYSFLFSGRVFYTPRAFLHAGIGFQHYDLTTDGDSTSKRLLSHMSFGNIGFGYKF